MKTLVVNSGSTSIKLDIVEIENLAMIPIHSGRYDLDDHDADMLLHNFLGSESRSGSGIGSGNGSGARNDIEATVHRVVHGGKDMIDSCLIDDATENTISELASLAPLHNPLALKWIKTCREQLEVPQVAVFDTAFFAQMPTVAKSYAVPQEWAAHYDIRRYGFHGIAHRALWRRWCELHPNLPDGGKLLTIQLGGGCSITAIENGKPMDTSMGFSPAEGLVMSTRCGDIDPGVIIHLMRNPDMSPPVVEQLINHNAGLLGLSGKSPDMRDLIEDTEPQAQLAVSLYCYRLRKYIGAYLAVLGGADGIVIGGGVGEHIPEVRSRMLQNMEWCGIHFDEDSNRRIIGGDGQISTDFSRVAVHVLQVNETAILAEEAYRTLHRQPP